MRIVDLQNSPDRLRACGLDLEYGVPESALAPGVSALELRADPATKTYLNRASQVRAGWFRTAAQRSLRAYISDYDANALLKMYPMFLLSTAQLGLLLDLGPEHRVPRCLDVGAGSGDVTQQLEPLCERLITTERSSGMAKQLRRRGYECLELDLAETPSAFEPGSFDLATCFNVLDRCPKPRSLMGAIRTLLSPGGRCLLSVPLPFEPMFYQRSRTLDPLEALGLSGAEWASAAHDLTARVLPELGLTAKTLSRVPYLSGGDSRRPLYALDAAVVLAEPSSTGDGARARSRVDAP